MSGGKDKLWQKALLNRKKNLKNLKKQKYYNFAFLKDIK